MAYYYGFYARKLLVDRPNKPKINFTSTLMRYYIILVKLFVVMFAKLCHVQKLAVSHLLQTVFGYRRPALNKKSSCRYDSRPYWLSVTFNVIQGR